MRQIGFVSLMSVDGTADKAWALAVQRAASILGVAVSPLRKVGNVGLLVAQAKSKASDHRAGCQGYARRLRERLSGLATAGVS